MINIEIVKAKYEHYNELLQFYNDVVCYLSLNNDYPGWTHGEYPFDENIIDGLNNETLYIGIYENRIVCALIVNHEYALQYQNVYFDIELNYQNVYILHTLAVHPSFLRFGFAKKMLEFVIDKARNNNIAHICLDVYEENIPARRLYESLGFNYIDKVSMGFESLGLNYFCLYEKCI